MIKLRNCKWVDFFNRINGKKLYCFGSGRLTEWLTLERCGYAFAPKVIAFVDNDEHKQGTGILLDGRVIPVISFSEFLKQKDENTLMLITSMYYKAMIEQMDAEMSLNDMECYVEVFLEADRECVTFGGNDKICIPPKIHYCWFGRKELPRQYKECIESWRKYCPDYEIIEWNEDNYDYKKIPYIRQAYELEKWAFVSDYVRLDVVYQYGGIYLDTDVEVVRNLDLLRNSLMFCGFEQGNDVNTGLGFGAVRGFEHLKKMRDMYHNMVFLDEEGKLNLTACTKYQTDYLASIGLQRNGKQRSIDNIMVYPRTVFAPLDFYGVHNYLSESTFTIHHYAASWFGKDKSRDVLLAMNNMISQRMKENV